MEWTESLRAALDVLTGRDKVIELAYRYGYDTPESFSKAFRRFHGASPARLQREPGRLKTFLPLKITITIQGGNDMDFTVNALDSFQVIGFQREFSPDTSYQDIPRFWDEVSDAHLAPLWNGKAAETALEKAVCGCRIGEYGVCCDICGKPRFRYLIAGRYDGREVPEGLTVWDIPAAAWARFRCSGPLPGALQTVNTRIFREWLPGNPDYELAGDISVEWYSMEGDPASPDYESAVWVPVRRKGSQPVS